MTETNGSCRSQDMITVSGMHEVGAESSPRLSACRGYQEHLRRIQRLNFEGRVFYHQPHITSWMLEKADNTGSSNVAKILKEVYINDPDPFPPRVEDNLLLFMVLLHEKIQCGHMYSIFQSHLPESYYIQLEDLSKQCERIRHDLETSRPQISSECGLSNYSEVIETFERLRWRFVPVQLHLYMKNTISHAYAILPFCYREVINDKGGTASVCVHGIQQDLVEDAALRKALEPSRKLTKDYGNCYELAVKSYMEPMKTIYEIESQAFQGIRDQQGVVQYLGEYRLQHPTIHYPNSPSHHIMLEYGEMDLDEYLAATYPPVLNGEIREFWEELFSVARTLSRIHHLRFDTSSGDQQHYRGWHGDIKPDNILRVRGQYKLADFGFAKFERERKGITTTVLLGGTRTYGAPECDLTRHNTRTPLSQTIDTWSFGCVLSSVATWVVLGSQAYDNYNERRKIAIKALKTRKAIDTSTSVPSCEDTFHDGRNVLPAVTEWHVYLRNSARKADTMTYRVLDLVDAFMLLPNPENRVMMDELCARLDEITLLSSNEYQQKVENGTLGVIGSETLSALLEIDNQAPLRAEIAQVVRSEADMRKSDGYGTLSQTEALDDRLDWSNRPRKSERFDKIVFAKIANRVQNSQLSRGISESPTQLPEETRLGSYLSGTWYGKIQEKIPDILLDSGDSPWTDKFSPTWPRQEEPLDVQPNKKAGLESPLSLPDMGSSHQKDVRSSSTTSNDSFKAILSGSFELPGSGAAGKSATAARPSHVPNLIRDLLTQESASVSRTSYHERHDKLPPLTSGESDPELSKTAIFHEYTVLKKKWNDQRKSLIKRVQGVPQDQRLQRFISKRDIVFVVDNAYSMLAHWDALKTTLLALAMRIGALSKDGLDLVYTCGDNNNVLHAKGWDMPKVFEQSIEHARLIMVHRDKTNIEETLAKLFDSYSSGDMRQRQTLFVLTNGLWEGSRDWNSAEKEIARYINALRENIKKREKRWFTIQFISFGQDQKALARLQELDDNLRRPDGQIVEDVVDTKPWYFKDVESLILGSIIEAADMEDTAAVNETDDDIAPNPSPAHSLTSVRALGYKPSSRVSKFWGKDS